MILHYSVNNQCDINNDCFCLASLLTTSCYHKPLWNDFLAILNKFFEPAACWFLSICSQIACSHLSCAVLLISWCLQGDPRLKFDPAWHGSKPLVMLWRKQQNEQACNLLICGVRVSCIWIKTASTNIMPHNLKLPAWCSGGQLAETHLSKQNEYYDGLASM